MNGNSHQFISRLLLGRAAQTLRRPAEKICSYADPYLRCFSAVHPVQFPRSEVSVRVATFRTAQQRTATRKSTVVKRHTESHNLTVINEARGEDGGNPLLQKAPAIPTLSEAMALLEEEDGYDDEDCSIEEKILLDASRAYEPNVIAARALITASTLYHVSLRDRDLRDPDYRDYGITANEFLHYDRLAQGELPSRFGMAPHARCRTLFVAAPVRMGRKTLARKIAAALGQKMVPVTVPAKEGSADYVHLPCLPMKWPIEGKLQGLGKEFFGAFDTEFKSRYATARKGATFREESIAPAMRALGAVSNLGVLLVDRINIEDSDTKFAKLSWSALAMFASMTGIPVICFITPGAAALSLVKYPEAAGELTTLGVTEFTPARGPHDKYWIAVCSRIFNITIRAAGVHTMPTWFPEVAFDITQGYPGLLIKASIAVALEMLSLKVVEFTQEIFINHGCPALALDQPHIDAIRMIRGGGSYDNPTLIRHGDWLSFSELSSTHLPPQLR